MFIPGNIKEDTKAIIQHSTNIILEQRMDVAVSRKDSRVARAIEWLLASQRSNGSWGISSVATTSLVMLALDRLMEPAGEWELEKKIKESLERAENFLLNRYQENQFESVVWDTAIATRALKRTGIKSQSFINERISWLCGLGSTAVSAGPHHIAQKVLTFAECGVQRHIIIQTMEECLDRVDKGRYKFSPYVLAQCLDALSTAQIENKSKPFVDNLINFLENTHLDSANFINICCALDAIAPLKNAELDKRMRLSIASLFGWTCFRDNGTWYHDEMSTAYALIALTRFSKEVVIRAPKSEIMHELNYLTDALMKYCDEYCAKLWKWWLILMANAFVSGGILAFFVTFTTVSDKMPEWLKWLLGTILSITIGFCFRYAYQYRQRMIE